MKQAKGKDERDLIYMRHAGSVNCGRKVEQRSWRGRAGGRVGRWEMLPNSCRGLYGAMESVGLTVVTLAQLNSVPLGNCSLLDSSKANSDQRKILNDL